MEGVSSSISLQFLSAAKVELLEKVEMTAEDELDLK